VLYIYCEPYLAAILIFGYHIYWFQLEIIIMVCTYPSISRQRKTITHVGSEEECLYEVFLTQSELDLELGMIMSMFAQEAATYAAQSFVEVSGSPHRGI